MLFMDRRETKVGGHAVRYYESGRGPALLLVHGAGATGRIWHRQMGPLSASFRVIAPDLPGFGGTDLFPDITTVKGYGDFLARLLDALGIGRASVVASSFGGWAACWFASEYPEMLDRLVLVSPSGFYLEEAPLLTIPELIEELKRYYTYAQEEPEELKRAVSTITYLSGAGAFKPDLAGRVRMIEAPTMIIWGREDRVVPPAYARLFKEGIRSSALKVMDGAGHLPYVERPVEFNDAVLEFMKGRS